MRLRRMGNPATAAIAIKANAYPLRERQKQIPLRERQRQIRYGNGKSRSLRAMTTRKATARADNGKGTGGYFFIVCQRPRAAPVGSMMMLNQPMLGTSWVSFMIFAPRDLALAVAALMSSTR